MIKNTFFFLILFDGSPFCQCIRFEWVRVCVWAIHLPNRNCIKLNECMQHYFVHTDVEVLFRLFGIHCKAFCTITNSKAMFCSVHAAAQLEPFTQTIFEHTCTQYLSTQNDCPTIKMQTFYMEIFGFPISMRCFVENMRVVQLPLTTNKCYYILNDH